MHCWTTRSRGSPVDPVEAVATEVVVPVAEDSVAVKEAEETAADVVKAVVREVR